MGMNYPPISTLVFNTGDLVTYTSRSNSMEYAMKDCIQQMVDANEGVYANEPFYYRCVDVFFNKYDVATNELDCFILCLKTNK